MDMNMYFNNGQNPAYKELESDSTLNPRIEGSTNVIF